MEPANLTINSPSGESTFETLLVVVVDEEEEEGMCIN